MYQKLWIFLTAMIILGSILCSCEKGGGSRFKERELKADSRVLKKDDPELAGVEEEKLFKGASKIILAELKKYNWKIIFDMRPEDKLEHEIFLVKEFPAGKGFNKIQMVITFTNTSGYKCHGCLGRTACLNLSKREKSGN